MARSSKDALARRKPRAKPVRRRKDGSRVVQYSEELAAHVCERIARGEAWSRIGGTDGMPEYSTLFYWRRTKPDFAEAFKLAQAAGAEFRADEVVAVSMEATKETIQEARLQVGSLKWHVARTDNMAKSNSWVSGNRRLVIRIRQFERAWRSDGTAYVREITASEEADRMAEDAGE
jgi:hypothetical protein